MGAWGYALFSDDTACDVRDAYHALLESEPPEIADSEATRHVLAQFEYHPDDPDEAVVWIALAAVQWKFGRLDPAVAERALQIIDDGIDLRRWEEEGPKAVAKRAAALQKVRAQLTGPQPRRRRLPMPRRTTLEPGDVLSYRCPDGRHVLVRVARIWRNMPVCALLQYVGTEIPPIAEVAVKPDVLWFDRYSPDGRIIPFTGRVYKGADYGQAGFAVIGNIGTRPGDDDIDPTNDEYWPDVAYSALFQRLINPQT